jgi:hypothetical protein
MDRSSFKRPATQTARQTTQTPFGNPTPVPKVGMPRPGGLAVRQAMSMDGFVTAASPRPRPALQQPDIPRVPRHQQGPSVAVMARRVPLDMELPG